MIQKQNSMYFFNFSDIVDQSEKKYLKPTKASLYQRVNNDSIFF